MIIKNQTQPKIEDNEKSKNETRRHFATPQF